MFGPFDLAHVRHARGKSGDGQMSMEAAIAANEPLKIAFYSPALPESGASNGIVTYTRVMRDAMRALGHEVVVVTTEYMEGPDGRVESLPSLNRLAATARLRGASIIGRNPGELWVQMNVRNAFEGARRRGVQVFELEESFGWAARLTGKGVAIVERLHGPHIFVRDEIETPQVKRSGDLREKAEFAAFKKVQAITSPTRRLLDELVPYGLDQSIAKVIPNPIPTAAPDASWRIGDADPDRILFVGRFDLCKGADIAIRAFGRACVERPSLSLVMVGPDAGLKQADGKVVHFDEFVRKEVSPAVLSRIAFLGPQSQDRLRDLRRGSGLAIIASRFETFSYSIAEAMSFGMPVLTSDSFGGRELVRDGMDGKVVPVGDVEATAEALLEMTANPTRLAEMGRSAYARAFEFLSPERIARQTIELYREAIARVCAS